MNSVTTDRQTMVGGLDINCEQAPLVNKISAINDKLIHSIIRGGLRHVKHVWPNRGPHTSGAPHMQKNCYLVE